MANSSFLARLIGPVMLVAGIALFLNRAAFRAIAEEFLRNRALLFLSGLLIMPAGLAIVLTHNVWALRVPVLITLVGWLMTIGGAVRLLVPGQVETMGRAVLRHSLGLCIAGGIWVAIGIALCIFGYFR